jgi:hypothetical protein
VSLAERPSQMSTPGTHGARAVLHPDAGHRMAWLAAAVVGVTLAATWLLSGVGAGEAARYVAFEALYSLLPGSLLYMLLGRGRGGWLAVLAIGWPCGYALEVGFFALTAALDVRAAFALLPLIALAAAAALLLRRRGKVRPARAAVPGREALAMAAAISAGIVLLAFTFYPSSPLPAHAHSVSYSEDNVFDISLAAEARHHWPITEPWVAGLPFHYYTATFMHVAAVNQVTGVSPASTVLRLLPATLLLLSALQLWFLGQSLGRSMGRPRWTGPLAAALLLAVADLNLDPIHIDVFHISPFSQFSLSPTFAFGVPFFLALLAVMQTRALPDIDRRRTLMLVALLIMGCGAAKTFAAADFIGGLGLFWLLSALTGRPTRTLSLCLVVSVLSIGAVYFLMLAGGMASSMGVHPLDFLSTGASLVRVKAALRSLTGAPGLWVGLLALGGPVLAAVLLAPLLGALWLPRRHGALSPAARLLLCMFAAGALAYVTLGAPGGVEGVFLVYGYLAAIPVAALGLLNLWSDIPAGARLGVVSACGAVLALALVLAGAGQVLTLTGRSRQLWYVGAYGLLAAAVVLAVLRLRPSFSPNVPTGAGRILACCILLLTVLGLTKPVTLTAVGAWKTIRHEPIAARDSAAGYGMNASLYRGLLWVRAHTTPCDVLAVNNHYIAAPPSVALYFYYSAFTERRVFLESWYYTPEGARRAQPFPVRYALNTQGVAQGDPSALRALREDGVGYVLIDKTHGGGARESPSVSTLIFSNSALDVYRLLGDARTSHGCAAVS